MFKSRRTLANILIFGSFILFPFLPWYIPFAGGVVAAWYFSYYEFIVLGFLLDVFFTSSHMSIVGREFVIDSSIPFVAATPSLLGTFFFTLIAAVIVLVLQLIKKRVRFY